MAQNMTPGCDSCRPAMDFGPVESLVSAGDVCAAGCTAVDEPAMDCSMAVICFPVQTYVAGFCPAEALRYGTLFPELVSPYQRGC